MDAAQESGGHGLYENEREKMNFFRVLWLCALTALPICPFARAADLTPVTPAELSPEQLVDQMDKVLRGNSHEMTVSLEVKTDTWERKYKIQVKMKGVDYTFARVLEPAKSAGQGFLRIKTKLWNYLPTAERTILIPPSLMLDKFLGSDFSNDDFVKMSYLPRGYSIKLLGKEKIGDDEVYHLELLPKNDAPVTYGKLELWLRPRDGLPFRWEFFDDKLRKIRVLRYSEFKKYGDHETPSVWEMDNLVHPTRKTVIKILDAKYDLPLSDSVFTREKLETYR